MTYLFKTYQKQLKKSRIFFMQNAGRKIGTVLLITKK